MKCCEGVTLPYGSMHCCSFAIKYYIEFGCVSPTSTALIECRAVLLLVWSLARPSPCTDVTIWFPWHGQCDIPANWPYIANDSCKRDIYHPNRLLKAC